MTALLLNHDSKICVRVQGLEMCRVEKEEQKKREGKWKKHSSCSLQHKDVKTAMASRCCFDALNAS